MTPDGYSAEVFAVANAHGIVVRAMTHGATILSLEAPDMNGHADDVVLGLSSLDDHLRGSLGLEAGRLAGFRRV